MNKSTLIENYNKVYNDEGGQQVYFAPSRVNMIGEHIDYNGGYVFPCALSIGTYGVATRRDDRNIKMYSENFKEFGVISVSLDDLEYKKDHDWSNYVKGVIQEFVKKYSINKGINIYITGNMPNGAGLSSSASLELLISVILNDLYSCELDMITMIKLAQKVENEYINVKCGIMDQFAIGMGKKDHAMLLNTATLECEYVPLILNEYKIVIANTNAKRELANSKYNERKSECESSLHKIQAVKEVEFLCDLNLEDYNEIEYLLTDVEKRRTRHVITENLRTINSVEVLKENKISEFGKLMIESHLSLKNDYEVTGIELDTLVDLMMNSEGVIGARMTGAGFGGSTVSIVRNEFVDQTIIEVGKKYNDKIGQKVDFYIITIGDGVRKL